MQKKGTQHSSCGDQNAKATKDNNDTLFFKNSKAV